MEPEPVTEKLAVEPAHTDWALGEVATPAAVPPLTTKSRCPALPVVTLMEADAPLGKAVPEMVGVPNVPVLPSVPVQLINR